MDRLEHLKALQEALVEGLAAQPQGEAAGDGTHDPLDAVRELAPGWVESWTEEATQAGAELVRRWTRWETQ